MHEHSSQDTPEYGDSEPRWDAHGARRLYRHYVGAVYAYVRSRIAHQQDAEDVVAGTFLKAVEQMDRFEWHGASAFRTWLFRIAYTTVQDYFRRQHRRPPAEPLDATVVSEIPLPEDALIRHEAAVQLERLLATLPPRRQEVVRLKFFAGLRNQDIATILELDERTVAVHLCRGLDQLHQRYVREETDHHERP